jgi:hypothetical protein
LKFLISFRSTYSTTFYISKFKKEVSLYEPPKKKKTIFWESDIFGHPHKILGMNLCPFTGYMEWNCAPRQDTWNETVPLRWIHRLKLSSYN